MSSLILPKRKKGKRNPIQLNSKWRITWDALQWKIQFNEGKSWNTEHFVAGKKSTIERLLHESGVVLTPDGERALCGLPASFKEFINHTPAHGEIARAA